MNKLVDTRAIIDGIIGNETSNISSETNKIPPMPVKSETARDMNIDNRRNETVMASLSPVRTKVLMLLMLCIPKVDTITYMTLHDT